MKNYTFFVEERKVIFQVADDCSIPWEDINNYYEGSEYRLAVFDTPLKAALSLVAAWVIQTQIANDLNVYGVMTETPNKFDCCPKLDGTEGLLLVDCSSDELYVYSYVTEEETDTKATVPLGNL